MIHVKALRDGPDFTGQVEVDIDGIDLDTWSGGGMGMSFTLEPNAARGLFLKLREALKVIEANEDPS